MRTAAYCGTRNLYADMVTAAKSLLYHNGADRVGFLIEDDVFPYDLPNNVKTINVSGQKWFDPHGPNFYTQWTYMSLMRLALTKILPQDDRVLYLDVDTIVNGDLSELWNLDLTGYYIAGARELYWTEKLGRLYVNAGVLVMNLKKLREDGMDDRIIELINTRPSDFPDQHLINECCAGHILRFTCEYNANDWTGRPPNDFQVKIYHFAAVNPWNQLPQVQKYRDLPWPE